MIKSIGTVTLPCKLNEQLYNLQFQVVKESVHSILGLQDSLHMKLVAFSREVFNLDCVKDHTLSQKMFKAYADLFKDDLPVTYSMKVDPRDNTGCQPSTSHPSCNAKKSGTRAPKNANPGE